uniref:Uncharacterized protein n=1 Tax=Anguilla anguilla TaxID=7936 RepID=A0A0E9T3V9_ANGAN
MDDCPFLPLNLCICIRIHNVHCLFLPLGINQDFVFNLNICS